VPRRNLPRRRKPHPPAQRRTQLRHLRRVAINLFRNDKSQSKSLPKKRKAAAWDREYLAKVLGLLKI
jgi:hypothetical protein